jgi:hypothetical protein
MIILQFFLNDRSFEQAMDIVAPPFNYRIKDNNGDEVVEQSFPGIPVTGKPSAKVNTGCSDGNPIKRGIKKGNNKFSQKSFWCPYVAAFNKKKWKDKSHKGNTDQHEQPIVDTQYFLCFSFIPHYP